jgi:hypothetical protein
VKMVLSFIAGIAVCTMLLFTLNLVLPVRAGTDNTGSTTDNGTSGLSRLLPDIEKIYRDSLTMPFKQAESKIYDKDIAEYYRALMDKTGLVPSENK